MDAFEYLITLISVLVGLAIADLATSLHRLLRARARVRWDWLPLAAALLALLAVLNFWWVLFSGGIGDYDRLGTFLLLATQLLLLFLLNAAALPDDVPESGLDLRAFYRDNGRYFWALYAGYILFVMLGGGLTRLLQSEAALRDVLPTMAPNAVIFLSFCALAFTRRRRLHAVVMLAWLVTLLSLWWDLRLTGS